jgi:extracellular factor (EF) 3-hydroxypalmitic acid methyl ester biosynthesis protein
MQTAITSNRFDQDISWIKDFVASPSTGSAQDWKRYDSLSKELSGLLRSQTMTDAERTALKGAFAPAMTNETLQGHVLNKPHGYAGDYEIIDRFYTFYTAPDERLAKWDHYLHSFPAVKAVRNRKRYIKELLREKVVQQSGAGFSMLNLASGPARDLYEFFCEHPDAPLHAECIDLDGDAIAFAKKLLGTFGDRVAFYNKNILRFTPKRQYDLVWSAGLFDYFNDEIFKRLITRFLKAVKPGGELIVGNFCSTNPDIPYMELLEWHLYHRSADDLIGLAMQCGVSREAIAVDQEPEGVNLFIRIRVS